MVFKNNRGSTFISVFFSLTLIALTLPFLIYILTILNQAHRSEGELAIHQFVFFLRDELFESTDLIVNPDYLEITNIENKKVRIEKYQQMIRRRVDLQGHEILLRDIKKVEFSPLTKGVKIKIEMLEGGELEKSFIHLDK